MNRHFHGILALLLVTLVWGTTFPAMKDLTGHLSAVWIIFVRFALAAVLLAPFLWRARADDLRSGVILGALLFFCFVFQVEGLALTSSNRNAFICGLNVLVVPLLGVLAGRLPERRIVLALLMSVAGLAALCWDGGGWGLGESLALMSALCFGVYVKVMEVRTRRATRLLTITAGQITTVALCALLWLLARELPGDPAQRSAALAGVAATVARHGWNLAYLGVIATAAIIALQTWGQSRATANEAAVVYAFEPAAAAVFGYFWLGEVLTGRAWLGGALLILGMIVSQWHTPARPAAALAPE
jgi:drug/metabolite transporter (DMT)-like permease